MDTFEITDRIKAVAQSAGLSEDEVKELLTGGGEIPQELMDVFERITDSVTDANGRDS